MSRLIVVTVTYNSARVLPEFLASLKSQSFTDFEVLFIDNQSSDHSRDIVLQADDSRFKLIANNENAGFSKGCNQGICHAEQTQVPWVLLINNDTTFPNDLFERLLNTAITYPVVVPKMRYADPADRLWTAGGRFLRYNGFRSAHTGMGEKDTGQYDLPAKIDFAPMCCMLISTEVFQRIGYLDEQIFAYCEDTDFCIRLHKAGIPIRYAPDALIFHKVSSLTGGTQSDFYVKNAAFGKAYVLTKHGSALEHWLWSKVYLMFYAVRRISGQLTAAQWQMARQAHARGLVAGTAERRKP